MKFRLALPEDKIHVAKLIVQALDELAMKFTNSNDAADLVPVIELFFSQKDNVYSYENTIVCEENGHIIGSITAFDGNEFKQLRKPFLEYIKMNHGFNSDIENETDGDEFYIDSLSVISGKQGAGVGAGLIHKMIVHAAGTNHKKIGLLVDKTNLKAKKLYERLGFEVAGEKTVLSSTYHHMVLDMGR